MLCWGGINNWIRPSPELLLKADITGQIPCFCTVTTHSSSLSLRREVQPCPRGIWGDVADRTALAQLEEQNYQSLPFLFQGFTEHDTCYGLTLIQKNTLELEAGVESSPICADSSANSSQTLALKGVSWSGSRVAGVCAGLSLLGCEAVPNICMQIQEASYLLKFLLSHFIKSSSSTSNAPSPLISFSLRQLSNLFDMLILASGFSLQMSFVFWFPSFVREFLLFLSAVLILLAG